MESAKGGLRGDPVGRDGQDAGTRDTEPSPSSLQTLSAEMRTEAQKFTTDGDEPFVWPLGQTMQDWADQLDASAARQEEAIRQQENKLAWYEEEFGNMSGHCSLARERAEAAEAKLRVQEEAIRQLTKENEDLQARMDTMGDAIDSRTAPTVAPIAGHCPTCDSPSPHLHPAVQSEGEVEVCTNEFHLRETPQNIWVDVVRAVRASKVRQEKGVAFCSFCGWSEEYDNTDSCAQSHAAAMLAVHVRQCKAHPLVKRAEAAEAENKKLTAEIRSLRETRQEKDEKVTRMDSPHDSTDARTASTVAPDSHTPGPWFVGTQNDALFIINQPPRPSNDHPCYDFDVAAIAKVYHNGNNGVEDANARLIAAAPDLLAALKGLWLCAEIHDDGCMCAREKGTAAIAKAEG